MLRKKIHALFRTIPALARYLLYKSYVILAKEFDPARLEEYVSSFAIKR